MSRQTIAIDIDDVLVDHYEAVLAFHNERYGTKHTLEDYTDHHWGTVWGTSPEETEKRVREFVALGVHNRKLKRGAADAVKKLHQKYDLVIVTVRRKVNMPPTMRWLQENFPGVFRDVRFVPIWEEETTQSKADVCRELGADYFIDDNVKHCRIAAEAGIPTLLFGNYPWNQVTPLPKGVRRVANWPEVLEYFDAR